MNIIKDRDNKKILIIDDNEVLMVLYYVPSYFICELSGKININNPIIIDNELDETFHNNIKWLMNQNYYFEHEYSYKNDNQLVWLSEHCFDISDELEVDNTPRLVIDKDDEVFKLYCERPFFEQNNIQRESIISFAPAGNGFTTKNLNIGSSFQWDIITVFNNTLEDKKIKVKSKKKNRKY